MNGEIKISNEMIMNREIIEFFKYFCHRMPGGFFLYKADSSEEIIFANEAMFRIFGCESKEEFQKLTGGAFTGIVHPDDYRSVTVSIRRQVEESPDNMDFVQYRIIRADGEIRNVEDYGRLVHTDHYGDIFCVFIEDVTERTDTHIRELERMNEKLRRANAREVQYKNALLHNAIAFFELNLTKNSFISEATHYTETVKNNVFDFIEKEKLINFSDFTEYWTKTVDPNDMEVYRDFFNVERLIKCYENGEPEQFMEMTVKEEDGTLRILHFAVMIGRNEITGDIIALSMVKDITKMNIRKKRYLQALSDANAANLANQAFLNNISQDIFTPINSIMCFTEVSSHNTSDPELLTYCMEKIREAGRELTDILNQALKMTNMKSGMKAIDSVDFEITELLEDLTQRGAFEAARKQIQFTVKKDITHNKVNSDIVRIGEILWQLIDNALKYTGRGGHVTLSVSEEECKRFDWGRYVFRVIDDGAGISPTFMSKLFEPFTRESRTEIMSVKGNGMGLAVVKNLVDGKKGTVKVDSEKGRGSTFTVELELPLNIE